MRLTTLAVGLLAVLTPLSAAWSKEDREIFRVRDEIRAQEGADITFYDILGITPSAGQDDITKAYRKLTRSLHPDKVRQQLVAERTKRKPKKGSKPGVRVSKPPSESEIKAAQKIASEKQTRLSLIANILRGPERERYDHFLANGFPVWKGTNYYYDRYRPGLGTVMIGLFIVGGGGFHYLAMYMSWKRQKEFVERYIRFARQTAWGENLGIASAPARPYTAAESDESGDDSEAPPVPKNRRERRMQQKESKKEAIKKGSRKQRAAAKAEQQLQTPQQLGPQGTKKRVVAENGKILLVDTLGDVYLEEEDEEGNVEAFLLDPNELPKPTIRDTAIVRVPVWIYSLTVGRAVSALPTGKTDKVKETVEEVEDDDSESAQPTPDSESAPDDFEMLDKSVDELGKAKSTGAEVQGGGKKRKGRKR